MKKNIFTSAIKTSNDTDNVNEVIIPELEESLMKLENLNKEIAELEKRKENIDSSIRQVAKNAMMKSYNSNKEFPGTLKIIAGNNSFLFITQDKYKNIEEDKFNDLLETYGEKVVEEETIFSFNPAILMKHKDHISKLLMNSKKLSKEDKSLLILNDTFYTIKKGTIKNLFSLGIKTVNKIIEDIEPVFSIKINKK